MTLENASAQFDSPDSLDKAIAKAIGVAGISVYGTPDALRAYGDRHTWHIDAPIKSIEHAIDRECEAKIVWKRYEEDYGAEHRATNLPPYLAVKILDHDVPACHIYQHEALGVFGEVGFELYGFVNIYDADYALYRAEEQ